MQKDIVKKLTEFGFTVNQAKVYLSIAQSGKTSVGQISKNTQLHRQDIYKLLPKLEKMGLITRTIEKPFMIEALPVRKALEHLIAKEKEAIDKRIGHLERNLKDIAEEVAEQPRIVEETRFTLLTTNEAMDNRINLTFKSEPDCFRVVSTIENLKGQVGHYYKQFFQMIANNKAKLHLLLVGAEDPIELKRTLERITPRNGYVSVKIIEKCPSKDYQVVDSNEVWIATQQKTQEGYPSTLWTNDPNIVETYFENFIETWNNPKAVSLDEDTLQKEIEVLKAIPASAALTLL